MCERKNKKISGWLAAPFLLTLSVLTVMSFIVPLRPTQSNLERRNLVQFPDFSVEALLSGEYFDGINVWFSDTFPGRESWLTLASYTQSFHGYAEVAIVGDLPQMETVPPTPSAEPSAPEPETQAEETTAPTEATEELWGGVDAGEGAEIFKSNSVIQIGDSLFIPLGFSQVESNRYIKLLNDFNRAVAPAGVTVINAPPPTSVGILIEEEYQEKLKSVSQTETLNYIHAGLDERIVAVDTVSALLAHNDEYVYFRTDHHWTALGAYYSYRAVCEAIGMEPVELDSLEIWDQGEFIGSQFGKAAWPQRLKKDRVDAYIPKGDIVNTVFLEKHKVDKGFEYPILSDTTWMESNHKYQVFGTDWPLAHAENRSLPEDAPNILVIKDSFGNCFTPFLTQNFRNVYSADYRKFRWMPLTRFVEDYSIDYVLFMPYMTATQSEAGTKMMRSMAMGPNQ